MKTIDLTISTSQLHSQSDKLKQILRQDEFVAQIDKFTFQTRRDRIVFITIYKSKQE